MSEEQTLYQIFRETGQEARRLDAALKGFFLESCTENDHTQEYGQYLKRRIRPAVEQLIKEEAIEKIQKLESLGWFHENELEGFIQTASRLEKPTSLMWLLHLKNDKYGYHDRDFSL